MSIFKEIQEEIKKHTPKTGYNVVGVDSFEIPGEQLFLIKHTESLEEAKKIVAEKRKNGDKYTSYYIYAFSGVDVE